MSAELSAADAVQIAERLSGRLRASAEAKQAHTLTPEDAEDLARLLERLFASVTAKVV